MNKHRLTIIALICIALLGSMVLWFSLRYGVGVSPDGAVYLSIARSLLNGDGFSTWPAAIQLTTSTHFPPIYPLTLALVSLSGPDLVTASQAINLFMFAANIFLVGWILYQLTKPVAGFALFGAFLIMTSTGLLFVHAWAFSEPLFLLLSLSGLYILSRYLLHPQPVKLLIAAALIGMATATRYAGLPLILVGMTGIMIYSPSPIRKKFLAILLFAWISILPLVAWMIPNLITSDQLSHRALVFHPESLVTQLQRAGRVISTWFVGDSYIKVIGEIAAPVFIACLIIAVIWLAHRKVREPLVGLLVLFIFLYLGFLAFSLMFIDAVTPLDQRILVPVFVCCVILILYALSRLLAYLNDMTIQMTKDGQVYSTFKASRPLQIILVLLCLVYGGVYLRRATNWTNMNHIIGRGYTSHAWQESTIIEALRTLPEESVIYANRPEAVYFLTGRPASNIPWKINPYTLETNPQYRSDTLSMRSELKIQGGVIVYFNDNPWYIIEAEKIKDQLSLAIDETQYPDGWIFWIEPDRSSMGVLNLSVA